MNTTTNLNEIKKLKEQYGLRTWWADEVASGNMTIEEAIASQKARDEKTKQLQESTEDKIDSTADSFVENLKVAESLR